MKSIKRGKILTILILLIFLAGLVALIVKVTTQANFYMSNSNELVLGKIYDRNGDVLYDETATKDTYGSDYFLDIGNLIGDDSGQMTNTLLDNNKEMLVNYSFLTGTSEDGEAAIYSSLIHSVNRTVYDALGSKNGTVIAYNYKTGEIYTCFSKPSVNILDGYDDIESLEDGSLMCKAFYGTVPGSTQKISTVAAAIETMGYDNLLLKEFTCTGVYTNKYGNDINCHLSSGHGTENVVQAFANSCNSYFAQLVADSDLSLDSIKSAYEKMGYAINGEKGSKIDINGILSFKASTTLTDTDDFNTQWGCMGQGETLVSPCQSMMWQSAIANKTGKMTNPYLISYSTDVFGNKQNEAETTFSDSQVFSAETASDIYDIMVKNGTENYSSIGYSVGVKSGTAQVENKTKENSLLSGFCTEEDLPIAFCIVIEDRQAGEISTNEIAKVLLSSLDEALNG
jgi:cell division protein FtsI/penicillin-binding protein 2